MARKVGNSSPVRTKGAKPKAGAVSVVANEEEVKIHLALPWLEKLGYKRETMRFNHPIAVNQGRKNKTIFADIVVYATKKFETPLLVIDTKGPNEILSKNDREQVISYARLLPTIAPFSVLFISETNNHVYHTLDKVRIKALPDRGAILKNPVGATLSRGILKALQVEAKNQLFAIDDVSTFKGLLSRCHRIIRNNHGYDPVQAFDELSKVLFAKMYEEHVHHDTNRFTLTTYKQAKALGMNIVQTMFAEIQASPMVVDLFPKKTTINLSDDTLEQIVGIFEKYDLSLTAFDVKGEAFEYFLGDTFTGGLGEYFTPRNIVEFIVEAVSPKIGEKMVDPFCGTGGFLIYAFDIVSEKIRLQDFSQVEREKWQRALSDESLYGTDWKERNAQACKMNMYVHGDGNTGIFCRDGFLDVPGKIEVGTFDICLTNPPFGATETSKAILDGFPELGAGRKSQIREVLAIERCINLLKPGGVVAMVTIDGVLNNDSTAYVRKYINENTEVLASISLNKETFQGYNAEAKTSILIMRKRKEGEEIKLGPVFMAVCTNTGYAPNGEAIAGNELPDILFDYKNWIESKQEDFIHPHVKVVTPKSVNDRLDADAYAKALAKKRKGTVKDAFTTLEASLVSVAGATKELGQLASDKFDNSDYEPVRLNDVLTEYKKRVKIEPNESYKLLGVRGKAGGIFEKPEKMGKAISSKYLHRLCPEGIIYSRLFMRNGSVAAIMDTYQDGVVSNEFPVYQVNWKGYDERELSEYIAFYLTSPQMMEYFEAKSTGSTKQSRARFKENQLLDLVIPIPKNKKVLNKIVGTIRKMAMLKEQIALLQEQSKDLPQSIQVTLPGFIGQ